MVKPKATSEQCLSKLSLTLELQTPEGPYSRKNKTKQKERNQKTNRNIAPDKSLDCVMTCAGTLKPNFSEAFKTLLKRKHSHSLEVKWYITQFTLPINHLERWEALWGYRRRPALSTENHLLTNPGHDFSNKRNSNSLRSCLWVLSNSNKVPHSYFMMQLPPPQDVIQSCFKSIFGLQRKLSACLTIKFVWKICVFALFLRWKQFSASGANDSYINPKTAFTP